MSKQQNSPIASNLDVAAERLGLGRTTINALVKDRELRAFKVRNRTLIAESELQRFVSERMAAAE